MNTYLAIITTILVITQVIRVIQNAVQLHKLKNRIEVQDEAIVRIWDKVEVAVDIYLQERLEG